MPEPGEITTLKHSDDIRICPACGYTYGFHTSFISANAGNVRPVKIPGKYPGNSYLPECGARYDVGWRVSFTDTENRVIKTIELQQHTP